METKLNENEFQCAMCKGIFNKGVSDEEADKEMKENFGDVTGPIDVICDNCYKAITIDRKPINFN